MAPEHILGALTVTVGFGFTVTVTDVVPDVPHPVKEPLMLTVIFPVGVNVKVLPLLLPVWLDVHV